MSVSPEIATGFEEGWSVLVPLTEKFRGIREPVEVGLTEGPALYVLDSMLEIATFTTERGSGLIFIDTLSSVEDDPRARQVSGLGWLREDGKTTLTGHAEAIFSDYTDAPRGQPTYGFVRVTPEHQSVVQDWLMKLSKVLGVPTQESLLQMI